MIRNNEIRYLWLFTGAVAAISAGACFYFDTRAGVACIAGLALCALAYFMFTRWRYRKLDALSAAVRDMSAHGTGAIRPSESAEGELSILQTEIYKLASRLTEQSAILADEKLALKDVLSDISHQLKTPLTAMSIMAELLEDETLPQEKREEFMRKLKDGLSRMEWMVLTLLKLARLDASSVEFKTERVSALTLARAALKPLEIMLELRGQYCEIIGSETYIFCDRLWSAEAITNVIKNASEHSPTGGEIRVEVGENPICAWIAVTGSGSSIDPADLPHIFKRFYRRKDAPEGGAGIGLSLSLGIMRAQHGDIEVRNARGEAAGFVLKFYKVYDD